MVGTGNELVRAYIAQHGVSYFDKDGGLQVGGPVFRQASSWLRRRGMPA